MLFACRLRGDKQQGETCYNNITTYASVDVNLSSVHPHDDDDHDDDHDDYRDVGNYVML